MILELNKADVRIQGEYSFPGLSEFKTEGFLESILFPYKGLLYVEHREGVAFFEMALSKAEYVFEIIGFMLKDSHFTKVSTLIEVPNGNVEFDVRK